jgi:hypothetical protein
MKKLTQAALISMLAGGAVVAQPSKISPHDFPVNSSYWDDKVKPYAWYVNRTHQLENRTFQLMAKNSNLTPPCHRKK